MQQIKDVIEKLIRAQVMAPRAFEEYRIANAWTAVNPPNISANAQPDKLVGGVLFLNVTNSAWAQQISMMKSDIANKINEALGERVIIDIKLRTGIISEAERETIKERPENKCPVCSASHYGEEAVCNICAREQKQERMSKLYRLVNTDPKMSFKAAKSEAPGITDSEYRRAKSELLAIKNEKGRKFGKKGS